MKHTLTDADRLELKSKLYDSFPQLFPSGIVDRITLSVELVRFFSDFYESRNTFSDNVTTDPKTCPTCGGLWVISKRYLARYLVRPLRILNDAGRAMTTKELTEITGNRQVYTKFAWLAHWQLVEKVGKSLYAITEKGRQFLRGEIKVPEFQWMLKNEVVGTPEGHEHPTSVFHYELSPTDTEDHREHVERSAPVS